MPRPPQGVRADVAQTTAVLPPEDTRGSNEQADPGRRRPVPQSPGTGAVATGRPGAADAQARAWYETDTSSWACKPTSRTTVAPLASGLPRRCGPSRKGVVAWGWPRSLLPPGPPPPWSPTERPQGCAATGSLAPPATARTRRPAGCDASGLLRQVGAAAMRPPLGSRATGSRRGDGGPLSAVGLPARLWSPGVRLGSLARPPADRLAGLPRQDGPSPRAQPQLPGLARPCPHRQTATPGGWNACTSRTVPREGPRVSSSRRSAFGRSTGAMMGRRT
jgi:hypothetical protein